MSDNIRVKSVLGRFLEHSRIFAFAGDDEPEVFIGSADLMHRNLDRRIEALITITDPQQQTLLLENIDMAMSPKFSAWELSEDGSWTRTTHDKGGNRLKDVQATYIKRQPKRRAKGK